MLGAAGLSLSLAGGASAATAGMADLQTRSAAANHEITLEITLGEEEITGVSLATFHVFDKENGAAFRPGVRLAMGGCGCGGCGACGGCWTGTDYTRSVFGSDGNPQYYSNKARAQIYAYAENRERLEKPVRSTAIRRRLLHGMRMNDTPAGFCAIRGRDGDGTERLMPHD